MLKKKGKTKIFNRKKLDGVLKVKLNGEERDEGKSYKCLEIILRVKRGAEGEVEHVYKTE